MIQTIRWSLSLGLKFGRAVPFHTISIALLTVASQISTLLAFFMPLKVVILLGSERIPGYIPDALANLGRETLIVVLSIATVGFFALYLMVERLIRWITYRATTQLLTQSQKMILFENQGEIAANAYLRYSRALAGGIFTLLALLGILRFYPALFAAMLAYGLLALAASLLLCKVSHAGLERFETDTSATLKLISSIGFFIVFGYLIADFMLGEPPSFIIALVSLIASRQILVRATGAISDLALLQAQRQKLEALFFHGMSLLPAKQCEDKTLWPLLQPERRESWVRSVLTELLGEEPRQLKMSWYQLGIPNIVALKVSHCNDMYLIKLFELNRSTLALHEAALMTESIATLPTLPWIGATFVGKHHCLVYVLPAGEAVPKERKTIVSLKTKLLATLPPKAMVQRFRRSRPLLWLRLDEIPWERLRSAAELREQRDKLQELLERFPTLHLRLKALPLNIVTPDWQPNSIWLCKDGHALLTNWGRWTLDPIGSGWLENLNFLPLLAPALSEAAQQRPQLALVSPTDAELAALAFALEQECNRQRFVQALELVPLLVERLDPCQAQQRSS